MKYFALIIASAFFSLNTYSQSDKRLKNLDKELQNILEVTNAVGFAVAIVEGDKIIYSKGFGYRDLEQKLAVDANTLFAIGSSTKAFTCGILGQLREDNLIDFDEKPSKYLSDFQFNTNDLNNNVIIKDLMSHRTGVPRHDGSWYLFPTKDKDSLLQRITHQEPFTGVRQQWYYNNFMFLAQGVIAERITNKSWEDNIRERFLEPLGMSRTNVSISELKESSNASLGYRLTEDNTIKKMDYYNISGMSPAGSINSSVNDMSKWIMTWLNNGKYYDQQILSERYINEAISSQMVVRGNTPDEKFPGMQFANYGYGWFLSSYRGHYRVEHGGNIDGFSANVAFFPMDNIGVVVLCNQNGSSVPGMVRNTVSDRMLKVTRTDWAGQFEERKAKQEEEKKNKTDEEVETLQVENTSPSHRLDDYQGIYNNPGYGTFEISKSNDSIFLHAPNATLYLKHYHYDVFEPFEVTEEGIDTSESGNGLFITFESNKMGEISSSSMKVEPTLDPIVFKHSPKPMDVKTDILNAYVGVFELNGMEIKIYTKKDVLFAFVKGQPEYELLATDTHKFNLKVLDGFKIEFIPNESGVFDTIKMIQPNGIIKAQRKK
ncbi:MAG: penicillin-binding protein [Bacteroidetes bacterium MedPE-SWsnd-G2]|nr:MAG: penicillin-binding protein [Bacteroidetes bacterium MedPE-SWsnd-G2]